MRLGLVPCALLLSVLVFLPVSASARPPTASASKPKAHKPKKCKKGRVLVKFGPKSRCLPLSKALPAPSAVDPRLAIIKEGLTPEITKIPDPEDRIPPPVENAYRQLDPKALQGMEKAMGIAIDKLDAMAATRPRPGLFARPAGFAHISAGESANSFTTTIGGVKIDGRLSIAIDATQQFVGSVELSETRDQGGGKTVKVTTQMPIKLKNQGFEAPECPTADGKLDGKDSIGLTVRTEIRSNGGKTLEEYLVYEVEDTTDPMHGLVGDDAKMDSLEIKSIEDVTESAGGSIWGGSIVKGSIVRNTVVDMRTGQYVPHLVPVSLGIALSGVLSVFTPLIRTQVAERLKRAADKGFAATVKFEIDEYREREKHWNEPNACAKLAFGKANESLTLERGQSGDESVRLDATRGGSPAKADWTVHAQVNAGLSLSSHGANPTNFHYDVNNAGSGVKVIGTFNAVSKAGVAKESWVQKTKEDPSGEIVGNFGGEFSSATALGIPSLQKWTGIATFVRGPGSGASGAYVLESGNVSVDLSGIDQSGITGCHQSGSDQEKLKSGAITVTGTGPKDEAPYHYTIRLELPPVNMSATRHDCPKAAQEAGFEGSSFDTSPFWKLDVPDAVSADGDAYVDSKTESFGFPPFISTFEENWAFHRKP